MKINLTTQQIFEAIKRNQYSFVYFYLLEQDIEVAYLIVKSLKLANIVRFNELTREIINIDENKVLYHNILEFYHENGLEYCHEAKDGKPPIEAYVFWADLVFNAE